MHWKLATSVLCLLLAVGCSSQSDVTATDSDDGGHIEIDSGQVLDIVLPDDFASSNAQWRDEQAYDDTILESLGSRFEPDRTAAGHTTPGTYTGRYQGGKAGTVRVTLIQEDDANPSHVARRFTLGVTVR
jgi:predicted secreted protein